MANSVIADEASVAGVVGHLAGALGTPRFHRSVLDIMRKVSPSDFAQVYHIGRDGRAICLDPCDTPEEMCKSYEREFSPNCPLSRYWQSSGRPGVVTMSEVRRDAEDYGNYFTDFYTPAGLVDEIGVLLPSPGRRTIALFLEKSKRFSDDETRTARLFYGSIARLHRANNQLVFRNAVTRRMRGCGTNAVIVLDRSGDTIFANREWRQASGADRSLDRRAREAVSWDIRGAEIDIGLLSTSRLDETFPIAPGGHLCILNRTPADPDAGLAAFKATFLTGRLSRREHEIVCHMLDGHPAKSVAERVGCSLETVRAHKKRIYRRLDITTEREIFLMFLDHIQGRTAAPPRPDVH